MLDSNRHEQHVADPAAIAKWIESTSCLVNIPARLLANFERRGPAGSISDDTRGNTRMHCASLLHKAALRPQHLLPTLAREKHWVAVYPLDVGKKGCRFLYHEALYPCEQCELVFTNGMHQTIEVMWCRRIDENCFAVGSRFVTAAAKLPAMPAHSMASQN